MREKDKIILEDSGESFIETGLEMLDDFVVHVPGLSIAWKLSRGLYGANIKLRQKRALEFVELIRDNPDIFTKQILETEEFQDGFVYMFEKYLSERSGKKRKIAGDIFCGFAKTIDRPSFELEKFSFILSQLSDADLHILSIYSDGTIDKWIASQPDGPAHINIDNVFNLHQVVMILKIREENYEMTLLAEHYSTFQSVGLVTGTMDNTYDGGFSSYRITRLGRAFIIYITA